MRYLILLLALTACSAKKQDKSDFQVMIVEAPYNVKQNPRNLERSASALKQGIQ